MKEETTMVQTFVSEKFGEIRTVIIDGEPYFVGKDVATALGYSNPRDALAKHVEPEDKKIINLNTVMNRDGIAGNPNVTVIDESGVYSLILTSTLPKAKEFKHWVTSEVLPSIARTNEYKKNTAPSNDKPIDEFTAKEKFENLVKLAKISPSNEQKINLINQAAKLLGVDVPNCSTETFGTNGTIGTKRKFKHKLSDEQVREIQQTYSAGNISIRELAKMYNVGSSTIFRVVNADNYPF